MGNLLNQKMTTARAITNLAMMAAFAVFLSAASSLAAGPAFAEERLISQSFSREMRREESMDLLRELNVFGRGRINSLILVVSAREGRGAIEVSADGMVLIQTRLDSMLTSIQVPVDRELGRGLQSLILRTRGEVTLAMAGVTMDEPFRTEPERGEREGRRGPVYGPGPIYGPGFPMDAMISQSEFSAFMAELKRESFDSGKTKVLNLYASYWGTRRITMAQLSEITRAHSFDTGRLDAVKILKPMLIFEITQMSAVLDSFAFPSNRDLARSILMAR